MGEPRQAGDLVNGGGTSGGCCSGCELIGEHSFSVRDQVPPKGAHDFRQSSMNSLPSRVRRAARFTARSRPTICTNGCGAIGLRGTRTTFGFYWGDLHGVAARAAAVRDAAVASIYARIDLHFGDRLLARSRMRGRALVA